MQKIGNSTYRGWITFYCECGSREYSYQNLDALKICECGTKQFDIYTLDIKEWIAEDYIAVCKQDLEKEGLGNHAPYIDEMCDRIRKPLISDEIYNAVVRDIVETTYILMENLRLNVHG